jgi:DICT domain-containing protein
LARALPQQRLIADIRTGRLAADFPHFAVTRFVSCSDECLLFRVPLDIDRRPTLVWSAEPDVFWKAANLLLNYTRCYELTILAEHKVSKSQLITKKALPPKKQAIHP